MATTSAAGFVGQPRCRGGHADGVWDLHHTGARHGGRQHAGVFSELCFQELVGDCLVEVSGRPVEHRVVVIEVDDEPGGAGSSPKASTEEPHIRTQDHDGVERAE